MGQIEQNLPHCTACHRKLETEQNYCPNCGQKIGRKRITIWSIISDTLGNYFSFERSGLATIYKVITTPKFIVDNYCDGNKGYFASPGKMVIFSLVIMALHFTFISKKILSVDFEIEGFSQEYGFFLFNFLIFVFISQLTFFRQGFKLARHFVSLTYIMTAFLISFVLIDNLCRLLTIELNGWTYIFYLSVVLFWNSLAFTRKRIWWMFGINFLIQIIILFAMILYIQNALDSLDNS